MLLPRHSTEELFAQYATALVGMTGNPRFSRCFKIIERSHSTFFNCKEKMVENAKIDLFWHFNELISTQNVGVIFLNFGVFHQF